MSLIRTWAAQWNVPLNAVLDLEARLGLIACEPSFRELPIGSEARQQSIVRLEAARHDCWLFRNNVGALKDADGRPVRYGLANDSKQMNDAMKSGDLIGWRKHLVTAQDVGRYHAIFTSREVKKEDWQFSGNAHEVAQSNWNDLINSCGGDAAFCTGPGSFRHGTA